MRGDIEKTGEQLNLIKGGMKCPEGTEPGHKAEGRGPGGEWAPAAAVDKSLWAKVAGARVLAGEPGRAEKAWDGKKETNNKPIKRRQDHATR